MNRTFRSLTAAALVAGVVAWAGSTGAQTVASPPAGTAAATPDNAMLLTIFLKHDQSRPWAS